MPLPDNGRARSLLLAGLSLAAAAVVGVLIAVLASGYQPSSQIAAAVAPLTRTPVSSTSPDTPTTSASSSAAPTTTSSTTTTAPPQKAAPVKSTAAPVPSTQPAASGPEQEVLALVNKQRQDNGCAALRWDDRLATAARRHSQDMAVRNFFSHDTPDGVDPWQRIKAAGYPSGSGENIAAGQKTAQDVMTSWMNSPGHRANILNCSSKALGVGLYKGGSYGTYWTQDFGF